MTDERNRHRRVKVVVPLPTSEVAPAETLWAKVLDDGLLEIENIPFFVHGLNRGDVVRPKFNEGEVQIDSFVRPGGRATFRVLVKPDADSASVSAFRSRLEALGCQFETATGRLWAGDIADHLKTGARAILEEGWRDGVWGYELSRGRGDSISVDHSGES